MISLHHKAGKHAKRDDATPNADTNEDLHVTLVTLARPDFRKPTRCATVEIARRHVPPRPKAVDLDVRALALWTYAAVLHGRNGDERGQEGPG